MLKLIFCHFSLLYTVTNIKMLSLMGIFSFPRKSLHVIVHISLGFYMFDKLIIGLRLIINRKKLQNSIKSQLQK